MTEPSREQARPLACIRVAFDAKTARKCMLTVSVCLRELKGSPLWATRRGATIFARVAERPRAVGELARELPVSRPAVSQHLKVLKDAGLVVDRAVGNRRIYRADPTGLAALRAQLDTFWNQALATYEEVVEHDTEEE